MADTEKPDYGLDAPGVIRTLFLVAAAGFAVSLTATFRLWPGVVAGIPLANIGLGFGVVFLAAGFLMVYYSADGKVRQRERSLNLIPWRGDEAVLDVGCGRGLMLCGAAKRLTTGNAVGVDVWRAQDLTGNAEAATLENARREGVLERVAVQTADMRQLPFPDASFDVVVSCAAVHNLSKAAERAQAVKEIARVLKPGGFVVLIDIGHHTEYAAHLKENGVPDVRFAGMDWLSVALLLFTFGNVNLGTLVGTKGGTIPVEVPAAAAPA